MHLRSLHLANKNVDMKSLRKGLASASQKKWYHPPPYQVVHDRTAEIKQRERVGSDLVILDCELSPASRQLWEFSMVEKVSGKILINTRVQHTIGLDHTTIGINPWLRRMSEMKASQVYGAPQRPGSTVLDVNEIAVQLKEAGITPSTVFLVWHTGRIDMNLLRELLESAGHYGILPPHHRCIS